MHFDVKEIVSAWISKVHPTEDQKKLAELRANICNDCEHCQEAIGSKKGTRYCDVCSCLIEAKIYSYKEGPCPEGKWDKIDTNFRNTKAIKVLKEATKSREPKNKHSLV